MGSTEINELIVLLIRETGWSLEYIRSLPIDDFYALVQEIAYQKALDRYEQMKNAAMIVATLASSDRHKYSVTDIIGPPPERTQEVTHDTNKEENQEPGTDAGDRQDNPG